MGRPWISALAVVCMGAAAAMVSTAAAGATPPPTVDDPAYVDGLQWNLQATDTPAAWRSSVGAGVLVAVVDSGVDASHPDLRGQIAGQVSCIGADGDASRCAGSAPDDDGHGTHVAGIIAAKTNNGIGIAGVAPRARLLVVRALQDACGDPRQCRPSGSTADIAAGIRWSVDHGARVVNLSLGTSTALGRDIRDAARAAWKRGVVTVLAAGNGHGPLDLASERILVVTATDRSGQRSLYASPVGLVRWGLAAPGGAEGDTADTCRAGAEPVGVFSTYWRSTADGSGYACEAGTSMAAPQVSGGLALLLAMGFTPEAAVAQLLHTARDIGPPGTDLDYGAGALDLGRAVAPPFPPGVRAQAAGLPPTLRSPRPPHTGPLAERQTRPRELPLWLVLVGGALSAAAAADLAWRWSQRRAPRQG
ncbi:MAG: peptidase [Acidimicrobiales bacterium]|nr:peptidase [Acidimicrobiales bacterium]